MVTVLTKAKYFDNELERLSEAGEIREVSVKRARQLLAVSSLQLNVMKCIVEVLRIDKLKKDKNETTKSRKNR